MVDIEVLQYLRDTFGTFKAFDCEHCSNSMKCAKIRYSRRNSFQCALNTYASLFELNRSYKVNPNTKSSSIVKRIAKLEMIGFKVNVIAPWVIMHNSISNKYVWIYPERLAYSDKIYDYIGIYGNFIVCQLADKISAFYINNLKFNILEGLPDIGKMIPYDGLYSSNLEVLMLKFRYMNKPCDLLVDPKGNRILVIGIDKAILDARKEHKMLSGAIVNKSGKRESVFIRLDSELKVLNHSKGIAYLEI